MAACESVQTFDAEAVVSAALDIGKRMAESGAEIRRVEDTVQRICLAYGFCDVEMFAIPSLLTLTCELPGGTHLSQSRRVYSADNDLSALEDLNALSRRICQEKPEPDGLGRIISEALTKKPHAYDAFLRLLGAALATGAFAVFFGGTAKDALAAALIGLVIERLGKLGPSGINLLARTFLSALCAGLLALLAVGIGLGDNSDLVMIGTIMLLIPGLALGSSIRDLLCGDVIAGSLRLVQVLLAAVVIAGGYGLALLIWNGLA